MLVFTTFLVKIFFFVLNSEQLNRSNLKLNLVFIIIYYLLQLYAFNTLRDSYLELRFSVNLTRKVDFIKNNKT